MLSEKIWGPKNFGSRKHWVQKEFFCPCVFRILENFGFGKIFLQKIFWGICLDLRPYGHHQETLQTPFRHIPDTLQTPIRYPPAPNTDPSNIHQTSIGHRYSQKVWYLGPFLMLKVRRMRVVNIVLVVVVTGGKQSQLLLWPTEILFGFRQYGAEKRKLFKSLHHWVS